MGDVAEMETERRRISIGEGERIQQVITAVSAERGWRGTRRL
jgi:hypothetical protein